MHGRTVDIRAGLLFALRLYVRFALEIGAIDVARAGKIAKDAGGAFDEVALITSTDGGATWSDPVRVNTPTGAQAFTPSVAVNSSGQVGVTYYDFRELQSGNLTTLPTDYFIRISSDHGQTFAPDVQITGPFDMLTAPFARGFFVGDYEALGVTGKSFIPFFVAANSGNTSNRTDVFATRI